MQGRIGLLFAGAALAVGGGIAGAVVVAPALVDEPGGAEVAYFDQAGKEVRATPQHTFQVAKKARSMARGARSVANGLVDQVNTLSTQTQQAQNAASNANSRLDAQQVVSNTATGRVQTDSETDYVSLADGPQVNVTVPNSGLIEVWAGATFGDSSDNSVSGDGVIALYEDGQRVAAIDSENLCQTFSPTTLENILLTTSAIGPGDQISISTPGTPEVFLGGCGVVGGPPGSILLSRSPGAHTYELRYGDCGCDTEPAAFSNRTLRVAPRP